MENWLRPLRKGDIEHLFENLRPSDRGEMHRAFPEDQTLAVLRSIPKAARKVVVWECPEGLVAVIGCSPHSLGDDTVGSPWVLATPLIETRWRVAMRHASAMIDWFHEDFDLLLNVKSIECKTHFRWLRRLGFHFFGQPVNGFQPFAHIRKEKP